MTTTYIESEHALALLPCESVVIGTVTTAGNSHIRQVAQRFVEGWFVAGEDYAGLSDAELLDVLPDMELLYMGGGRS